MSNDQNNTLSVEIGLLESQATLSLNRQNMLRILGLATYDYG